MIGQQERGFETVTYSTKSVPIHCAIKCPNSHIEQKIKHLICNSASLVAISKL